MRRHSGNHPGFCFRLCHYSNPLTVQALLPADGNLSHKQILTEGGHGAYIRKAIGFSSVETILATGPKRQLLEDSTLPIVLGAPLGDNMMTGTLGLLSAIRKHKDFPEI